MAGKLFHFGLALTIVTILLIFIAVLMTNYREHETHSGFVFTLAGFTFVGALGCWIGYWTIKIKGDVERDDYKEGDKSVSHEREHCLRAKA